MKCCVVVLVWLRAMKPNLICAAQRESATPCRRVGVDGNGFIMTGLLEGPACRRLMSEVHMAFAYTWYSTANTSPSTVHFTAHSNRSVLVAFFSPLSMSQNPAISPRCDQRCSPTLCHVADMVMRTRVRAGTGSTPCKQQITPRKWLSGTANMVVHQQVTIGLG